MDLVGPQYIYQRESGGYKFHALVYMFAALHRMSTVEFVWLAHFVSLWFDSNLLVAFLHWMVLMRQARDSQMTITQQTERNVWLVSADALGVGTRDESPRECVGGYEKPALTLFCNHVITEDYCLRHPSVITWSYTSLCYIRGQIIQERALWYKDELLVSCFAIFHTRSIAFTP